VTVLDDIFTALTEHAELAALVEERVYPANRPPKSGFPCVTYFRVDHPHGETHTGCSMSWPRYQFIAWSEDPDEAEAVALALKGAIRSIPRAAIIVGGGDIFQADVPLRGVRLDAQVYTEEVA